MEFSLEQQKIINSSIDEDILVNAGAGSGKTTVLTEKVIQHLIKKDLEPSQLLVLTFTNNAAHEMKTRIVNAVNKIKCEKPEDVTYINKIKASINSAHIQTFDSFAQEIVKEFGYLINISNTITIANDFVLKAKIIDIVHAIFDEMYRTNDKNFITFLTKYNLRDDKKTEQVIISLVNKLINIPSYERDEYIENIKSKFDDDSFFDECWKQYRIKYKEKLIKDIQNDNDLSPEQKVAKINNEEDLIKKVDKECGDKETERKEYQKTKIDFDYLEFICKKVIKRLDLYKQQSCLYTYGDIADYARQLILSEKYKTIVLNSIRNRFKYLLVDEYQDTNNLQEDVINAITKDYGDGKQIHLFCVGDKKQSIYGFRNSNVEIFENRIRNLGNKNVINMNDNYRSFKELIDANNEIFKTYMTISKGGVDYEDKSQQLKLPKQHIEWKADATKNSAWGLHVLTCNDNTLLKNSSAEEIKDWECQAIIKDIKTKKENKFQIYDVKTGEYRNCDWSDFAILVRTKANFVKYEKAFANAGIPLNNKIATNLVEINAIMLINSLIKALDIIDRNTSSYKDIEIFKHCYVSIARSFIYRDNPKYTDQYILDSLNKKDNECYLEDDIVKKIKQFYKQNKNKVFSQLFINLLNEFNITKKLYSLGENEKNIAKIESLYSLIIEIEKSGGTIKDFASLLEIISKHNIEITDDTVVDMEKAVSLSTIHQSKGLQWKIVYLPNSVNHIGGPSNINKPDYDLNKDFGFLVPIYKYNRNIYSIPYRLFKILKHAKIDIDEHVRLFYVVLTRAEQLTYIVGYPKVNEKNKINEDNDETLFDMLSEVWKTKTLDWDNINSLFPKGNWHKLDDLSIKCDEHDDIVIKNIDDRIIEFKPRSRSKASQFDKKIIDDEILNQKITLGNELHDIMERVDFEHPDNLDFIGEKMFDDKRTYKDVIRDVLNMDLFRKDLIGSKFYQEYPYYDEESHTSGYIDLLAIKNGIYYIIDYKLMNIDKEEYKKQLYVYMKNIKQIFNIKEDNKIRLILLSLVNHDFEEIIE